MQSIGFYRVPIKIALLIPVFCILVVAVSIGRSADANVTEKRPNIIVIMTDDQDDRGSLDVMVNVRKLIFDQGVHFRNSFVDFPLCCPSRVGFLTGQLARNHGVKSNRASEGGGYAALLPTEHNTLPVWLQNAGYTTVQIGKYVNGYGRDYDPKHVLPGWTESYTLTDRGVDGDGGTYRYFGFAINENGTVKDEVMEYQTDYLTRLATDFIEKNGGRRKPYFMWLSIMAPHSDNGTNYPVPAPRHKGAYSDVSVPSVPSFNEADVSDKPSFMQEAHYPTFNKARLKRVEKMYRLRRETLLSVDESVAAVIETLKAVGDLENTYVIFTSDNGFLQGEHRVPRNKYLLYEESIRVPLGIRGPSVPRGIMRDQLVLNLDLSATIVDLAKARPGRVLDGMSLVPLFGDDSVTWRTLFPFEGIDITFRPKGFYGRYTGIHTGRFVYAEHVSDHGTVEYELYDLFKDPHQLENVARDARYKEISEVLKKRHDKIRTCSGRECWDVEPVHQ